jgi:hypothetical protein
VDHQETAYQPELSVSAVNSPATDVPEKDYKIEELDAAQEELLSWMLFWDGAAQEKDLDEMQDYEELTDQPEFDEAFELEVEDMLEKASDINLRPGEKIDGTVYEVDEDGAYVEIGAKSAGFVPVHECSLAKLKSVSCRPELDLQWYVLAPCIAAVVSWQQLGLFPATVVQQQQQQWSTAVDRSKQSAPLRKLFYNVNCMQLHAIGIAALQFTPLTPLLAAAVAVTAAAAAAGAPCGIVPSAPGGVEARHASHLCGG